MTVVLPALPTAGGPISASTVEKIEAELAIKLLSVMDIGLADEWRRSLQGMSFWAGATAISFLHGRRSRPTEIRMPRVRR